MHDPRSTSDSSLSKTSSKSRVFRLPFGLGGAAEPKFHAIDTAQAHWDSLRADRVAPGRDEVDPRSLAECLDVMFIAELVAPRVARIRLSGQSLYDILGLEPRGMPLAVFFEAPARDAIGDALAQVAEGARVLLPLRSDRALGRPLLEGMLLLLPLTDHTGKITRVMGVLETLGPVGRAPRKFNLSAAPVRTPAPSPDAAPEAHRPVRGSAPKIVRSLDNDTGSKPMRPAAQSRNTTADPQAQTPRFRVIQGGKSD